jgi:hypothetical protein
VKTEVDSSKLPEKVLNMIIGFCDGETLLNLSLACKHIRQVVLESENFSNKTWLNVDCEDLDPIKLLDLVEFTIDIKCKKLKLVNLHQGLAISYVQRSLLSLFSRLGRTVEEICVRSSNISDKQLCEIMKRFSNIKTIQIIKSSIKIEGYIAAMTELKELSFVASTGISFFSCVQLEALLICCCDDKSMELEVQKFLEKQKKLKRFLFDFEHVQL